MKQAYVKFDCPKQIIQFVETVSKCDYDIDIKYGSCVVDAKSILGVLSLAHSKTVEVIFHSDDCKELIEEISVYAA